MKPPSRKLLWLGTGLGSAGLVSASLVLTPWLNLHPCHLCIFQRLLFMLIAVLGVTAAFVRKDRIAGSMILPLSAVGIGVAGYQSWLQMQPANAVSCVAGKANPIETLVEWLGQQAPSLFLATGACENEELVIFGLSLANWAFVAFLAFFVAAGWALLAAPNARTA
jgi:disulfide bond formation protein DsbB